jgi:hypothetical protein
MNQSLQGENLDLAVLDERVENWKTKLSLLYEVPPKNFSIEPNGVKFHDRSHLLIQDFLGRDSESLASEWNERGLPSIFEEVLTVFCANLVHFPEAEAESFCNPGFVSQTVQLLMRIGYLTPHSPFILELSSRSVEIAAFMLGLTESSNFYLFRKTLEAATLDCPNWDRTQTIVNG